MGTRNDPDPLSLSRKHWGKEQNPRSEITPPTQTLPDALPTERRRHLLGDRTPKSQTVKFWGQLLPFLIGS